MINEITSNIQKGENNEKSKTRLQNPEGRKKLEDIGLRVHSLFKMEELIRASKAGE